MSHTIYEKFQNYKNQVKQIKIIKPFAFIKIGEKNRDFWFEFLKISKKKINLKVFVTSVVYMLFITS